MTERKHNDHPKDTGGAGRRRGAIRTAIILAVVVVLIYLVFIGRTALHYLGT